MRWPSLTVSLLRTLSDRRIILLRKCCMPWERPRPRERSAWFSQLRHSLVAAVVVAVTEAEAAAAAAAVDTEAAWVAEAASMAVDLVVVGASTAAVVASIAVLVSTALV